MHLNARGYAIGHRFKACLSPMSFAHTLTLPKTITAL